MSEKLNKFLCENLNDLSSKIKLPEHDYLFNIADAASSVLENEIGLYRPACYSGTLGGLIDFSSNNSELSSSSASFTEPLPLIIVPDLHARCYFLQHILNYVLPLDFVSSNVNGVLERLTVFQGLQENKVRIVFVGDLLHSELRCRARWLAALQEFDSGIFDGKAMSEEMQEGLLLLCMIMELKVSFCKNVHILKGNHENIMNVRSPGDFPFRKFANEGEMVKDFMSKVYGDDVLMVISCFEKNLPLLASFDECVISHAEPKRFFSYHEIVNGMDSDEVILGLTWTENNAALLGSVQKMLKEFTKNPNSLYFGGHRPIQENYSLRQNGKYVQIHNPDRENIVLVRPGKSINLKNDIVNTAE